MIEEDIAFLDKTEKSWYKIEKSNIEIRNKQSGNLKKLSNISAFVKNISDMNKLRLYVKREKQATLRKDFINNNLSKYPRR